ncbi:sulfur carrier protein ThiS [Aliidiomarina minuta]|uniref:sulfur carrier protein ThiS n=1 Tax=Aliidiomarina minuta TaxID=880057 RepID=UPI0013007E58|nr:sulfur carrier protein ThiS [Aliidiomarina minuta]
MQIIFNQQRLEISTGLSISALLEQQNIPIQGVAVAVNNEVIPRSLWQEVGIQEQDQVAVFQAVAGG